LGPNAAAPSSTTISQLIQCRPHAIYLVVESEMIRLLAALIRLFFSDLIGLCARSIQNAATHTPV